MEEVSNKDVKITPKQLDAVIIEVKEKLALEVYGSNTDNPQAKMVSIGWENAKEGLKGEDNFPHYEKEELTDNTRMGKLLLKYETLKVGTKIVLEKNDRGFYKIQT